MDNLGHLISTVQDNCHISDARYAGNYTMCIFLLKMREMYRWEHDLPLTAPLPRDDLGDWLVAREQQWDALEANDYAPLAVNTGEFDPFDAEAINAVLLPHGLVYSGGYGLHHKPHFFLGSLVRTEQRQGLDIHISSCEYARDLVAPPAMMRQNTVFIRQESLRRSLWERVEGWQWNKSNADTPMGRALATYGKQLDFERLLDRMTDDETEAVILHEVGEAMAGAELGPQWEAMLVEVASSKAEFVARAARDLLADCLSTLPTLIADGNDASLHFYFANLTGMRKHLFPELAEAYERWLAGGRLEALNDTVKRGQEQWLARGQQALAAFGRGGADAPERVIDALEAAA